MRILLILALVFLGYVFFQWLIRQPRKVQIQLGAIIAGVALLLLAVTGRLHWLFALIGATLPFLGRVTRVLVGAFPILHRMGVFNRGPFGAATGPTPGRQSDVQARFVSMSLDHDTGEIDGKVHEGAYRGKKLGQLDFAQLCELFEQCLSEDEESAQLLQAYMERIHADAWEAYVDSGTRREAPRSGGGDMTREEAFAILGLQPDAGEADIIDAHRKLMQKMHPDRGGSDYLAAKINQAKDKLLG
ncbi:MAG: DnaJ domain-containing protein [Gammaproteobacteria bacterium]